MKEGLVNLKKICEKNKKELHIKYENDKEKLYNFNKEFYEQHNLDKVILEILNTKELKLFYRKKKKRIRQKYKEDLDSNYTRPFHKKYNH